MKKKELLKRIEALEAKVYPAFGKSPLIDAPKENDDKFAELKEAHKNGAVIQFRDDMIDWTDCAWNEPFWNPDIEYRIKPDDKPKVGDVVKVWKYDGETIIGIVTYTDESEVPYKVSGVWFENVEKITDPNTIELFNNGAN